MPVRHAGVHGKDRNMAYELDRKIADLYGLTPEEYRIVKSTMEDENLFLY